MYKSRGIRFIIFICFPLVFSCQKADEKPQDILTQAEMVKVLAEIYIAEQKVTEMSLGVDSAAQVFNMMDDKVFENTGIPDSVFKKSVNYYVDRPKEMEKIYSILVDSLQLREQRIPQ